MPQATSYVQCLSSLARTSPKQISKEPGGDYHDNQYLPFGVIMQTLCTLISCDSHRDAGITLICNMEKFRELCPDPAKV